EKLGRNGSDATEAPRGRPECLLSHCIVGPAIVLDPALPSNVTLKELLSKSGPLSSTKQLLNIGKPLQPSSSVSVLLFHSQSDG
ncbi:N-acetylglucosamine-1-phosphotransferase subunits alpha/beta isoform X1, partial [Tachysurus ichikawai]